MKVSRSLIAKEAGVTPTTVSCVINNTRPVSDKMRHRVMTVIEKYNYVPDLTSRAMLGMGSKQIAIMVESIKNPFFAELVSSIEEKGIKKGFFFNICGKMDLKKYVPNIIARNIDAVYFCSEIKDNEVKLIGNLLDNNIKVLTGQKFKEYENKISNIEMSTGEALISAVKYLYNRGHRKIAFLNTFSKSATSDDRLNMYNEQVKKLSLENISISSKENIMANIENGKKLFKELIKTRSDFTAIIGINDLVTIGAMNEAQSMGYKVPEDFSFIGIDGIELSDLVFPKLTTFLSNASILGEVAFKILNGMIEENKIVSYNHKMKFIERDSVCDR